MGKRGPDPTKANEKQTAFHLLVKEGVSPAKAAAQLGYTENYGYTLMKKIKEQKGLSLTDPILVRQAHKTIKSFSKGKTVGDIKEIKCSTALAAAKEITDRAEPKVSVSASITAKVSPIDLSKYLSNSSAMIADSNNGQNEVKAQDVVFEDIDNGDNSDNADKSRG